MMQKNNGLSRLVTAHPIWINLRGEGLLVVSLHYCDKIQYLV